MMTVYHPVKIPGRPRRYQTFLGLTLLLVVLFSASRLDFLRHLASGASLKILTPFWSIGRGVENFFSDLGGLFTTKLKLADENLRLRTIIDQQSITLLNQENLKQENLTLRQIFNRGSSPSPITVGRFVSTGRQFPSGQAVIDVGAKNVGAVLVPGIVVVSGEAVALGELTEVYSATAKMRFYSASGERLFAQLGENHVPIELIGRGGGNFLASLPRDLIVTANDRATITIAGHDFVIAVVNDFERGAGDSFQKIFLRSPVNVDQLIWVEMYAP